MKEGPDGGARRAEIIRSAADLFYQQGYDVTTTQDIADRVGMLKGSLYYYIASKEDLLFEIIDGAHEVWTKNLELVRAIEGDAAIKLWVYVHGNVMGNVENLVDSGVFFREFRSLSGERRGRILGLRDEHDNFLRRLIREGQDHKLMRTDVNPKLASTAILTMCNALYQWYTPGGAWSAEEVATSYADLALSSLSVDERQRRRARARAATIVSSSS
jgi:AcrR family transcriptional regulator